MRAWTQHPTERSQPEERSTDPEPPPWTDVISLELALRGESDGLEEGVKELADDSADEATLLRRIAERWARDWKVLDHRLSRAIERHSSLNESTPPLSKAVALEEGLINALLEAEERGITKVIENGTAEDTWWFTDLRQQDLERAATIVLETKGNGTGSGAKDSQSPSDLRDFERAVRWLEKVATGADTQRLRVAPAKLRAFLFARWVRGRATQSAKQRLLATLYRYPDGFFAVATL